MVSVKEFPTCNYVVVVSTPFLCKHPAFLPTVSELLDAASYAAADAAAGAAFLAVQVSLWVQQPAWLLTLGAIVVD